MELKQIPEFFGCLSLKTDLTLEQLGDVLSEKIFAGVKFGGKDKSITNQIFL